MKKLDHKKELKHLCTPSPEKVEIVEVREMNFLVVDGEGDPNTAQSFADAMAALYLLSYTLKFMVKKGEMGIDDGVLPLEALWVVRRHVDIHHRKQGCLEVDGNGNAARIHYTRYGQRSDGNSGKEETCFTLPGSV